MRTSRAIGLCFGALGLLACGGRAGSPPQRPPLLIGTDGQKYYLLEKGPYKAFYDEWGRLARIEYDANEDGKADHVAHHEGQKLARMIEVDADFDGAMERWEYYDDRGLLQKVGAARNSSAPDIWSVVDANGLVVRMEYDDDGNGAPERWENLNGGLVVGVELDTDRDGQPDRWQDWDAGRLRTESFDTDADHKPDRRIRYGEAGEIVGVEPIGP